MQLSLQNFSTLVDSMASTVQGACSSLIDLTVGSVMRAILEASASVGLWLQYLVLQVLTMTRLATSIGSDADSWVQDFGMTRLAATYASGSVVLSSFSPATQSATINTGATVRTSDGSQTFAVVNGPYMRQTGTASVTVQVQATVPGTAGNVQSGVVNVLGTAIPGIDTVSNPTAFTGGQAAETDSSLRLRFVTFINTRAQATEQAFVYAIISVQQNLTYSIQENIAADGSSLPGHVHIIVDDGSGKPTAALLASVSAAVDEIRPIGTSISVAGPSLLTAGISLTLTINSSADGASVQSNVNAALASYINGLGVGQALRISRIAGLCYDADANVSNVQDVLLNGAGGDVGGQAGTVVRSGVFNIAVLVA